MHVNGALNAGLTPSEIVEALLQAVAYCGVPRAVNATLVAKKVFAERNLLPVRPTPSVPTRPADPAERRGRTRQGRRPAADGTPVDQEVCVALHVNPDANFLINTRHRARAQVMKRSASRCGASRPCGPARSAVASHSSVPR
ncbi:carboxymuconolactone decarboxylase family protein [Micromonospora chersina]|uniref:carboxymuconolactone decarboxylase family protein n=1 Tax=Micromonospora chersina TaxID=47854 RepID=UPI0033E8D2DD